MKKLFFLLGGVFGGLSAFALALIVPVAFQEAVTPHVPEFARYNPLLIAYTFAQTAPETIAEMSTEVAGFANSIMPAWLIYVVFALIAALGIWLIGRAIRAMKSG